jgi:hypothetical protein
VGKSITEEPDANPEKRDADIQLAVVIIVTYLTGLYGLSVFSLYRRIFVEHIELFKPVIEASDKLEPAPPLKHFKRISKEMEVVYRLAIFDSFLNNVTRYALARRPEKAVGQAQMHVGKLINSTKSAIINSHIESKARSIGTGSFVERIQALERIMDVRLNVPAGLKDKLRQVSRIRNEIVHTVGDAFPFSLDENMSISSGFEAKGIELQDDFDAAFLGDLTAIIYETFVVQFLGRELHGFERTAVNAVKSRMSLDDSAINPSPRV